MLKCPELLDQADTLTENFKLCEIFLQLTAIANNTMHTSRWSKMILDLRDTSQLSHFLPKHFQWCEDQLIHCEKFLTTLYFIQHLLFSNLCNLYFFQIFSDKNVWQMCYNKKKLILFHDWVSINVGFSTDNPICIFFEEYKYTLTTIFTSKAFKRGKIQAVLDGDYCQLTIK